MTASLRIDVLTLFPRMFDSPFAESIVARARQAGRLELEVRDIRSHTTDKHHVADDTPYGGGAGMVLKPEPLTRAIRATRGTVGHVVSRILHDLADVGGHATEIASLWSRIDVDDRTHVVM